MKIIVIVLFVLMSLASFAQDIVLHKDGSESQVKVLEVGIKYIKYKRLDNLEGPTYSIYKSQVVEIRYENGKIDLFKAKVSRKAKIKKTITVEYDSTSKPLVEYDSISKPLVEYDSTSKSLVEPYSSAEDSLNPSLDNSAVRDYIYIQGAINVGVATTSFYTTNGNTFYQATNYTRIGFLVGISFEMGNVIYFSPQKMPQFLGIGLNFTWVNFAIMTGAASSVILPYTTGLGPHFSFKINSKMLLDIYAKPSIAIIPVSTYLKPTFLMDVGINFRYKSLTVGIAGAIIPSFYEDFYDVNREYTSQNVLYEYSHLKIKVGISFQKKY